MMAWRELFFGLGCGLLAMHCWLTVIIPALRPDGPVDCVAQSDGETWICSSPGTLCDAAGEWTVRR